MSKEKSAKNGLGFGTVLFLIFLVMKLAKIGAVANWNWWWVFSPLWIPIAIITAFFVIALVTLILKSLK